MTAQDVLYMAFRRAGQMRAGWTPSDDLLADGLREWFTFYDSLNAERTSHYSIPDYVYPTPGPGSMTDGNGYLVGPVFTFSGTTVIGSAIVAAANTFGLIAGMMISGAGIPASTTIASVSPGVGITMSANATAAATVTITVTPDWIGPRPESIIGANLVQTSMGPNPVYIQLRPVGVEEWKNMVILQIPGVNITSIFWYNPTWPAGIFNVFPPLIGNSIQLYTWGQFAPPPSPGQANYTTLAAALATPFSYPPGYTDYTEWTLAARLKPLCPKVAVLNPLSQQWLEGRALEAKQALMAVNRPTTTLSTDAPSGGSPGNRGNYDSFVTYTGEPY